MERSDLEQLLLIAERGVTLSATERIALATEIRRLRSELERVTVERDAERRAHGKTAAHMQAIALAELDECEPLMAVLIDEWLQDAEHADGREAAERAR